MEQKLSSLKQICSCLPYWMPRRPIGRYAILHSYVMESYVVHIYIMDSYVMHIYVMDSYVMHVYVMDSYVMES